MSATGRTPEQIAPTSRTRVRRLGERGVFDRAAIYAILDEALFCHVGFVEDGQPYVIPTIHARSGDVLYLHGSTASRMQRTLATGTPVCVTVTLLDGVVLARSVFHHSMNYRSVVVLGTARRVESEEERREALRTVVEHVMPGRGDDAREPSAKELAATSLVAISLAEASAKVRTGPPKDDEDDLSMGIWAGVVPMRLVPQAPLPDAHVPDGVELPGYVRDYRRS